MASKISAVSGNKNVGGATFNPWQRPEKGSNAFQASSGIPTVAYNNGGLTKWEERRLIGLLNGTNKIS